MKDFEKRGREQARQYLEGLTKRVGKGMTAKGNKRGCPPSPPAFHSQHRLQDRNSFHSAEFPSNQGMGIWKASETETEQEHSEEEGQGLETKTSGLNPGSVS